MGKRPYLKASRLPKGKQELTSVTLRDRREGSVLTGKRGPHATPTGSRLQGAAAWQLSPCPEAATLGIFRLILHWTPQVLYLWASVLLLLHG